MRIRVDYKDWRPILDATLGCANKIEEWPCLPACDDSKLFQNNVSEALGSQAFFIGVLVNQNDVKVKVMQATQREKLQVV